MSLVGRSFIILFSEAIWIYYVITLFASIELGQPMFTSSLWWVIAGIVGYTVNRILLERVHYIILAIVNFIALGFILYQNWMTVPGNEFLVLKIVLSLAVTFVFVRGASFLFKRPGRKQMLQRFEGNITFYALLVLVFVAKSWSDERFHAVFLIAIFLSLLGMILSLQHHDQVEKQDGIEVRKVGQSGWFAAVVTVLFIGVALASSLLFLPAIRQVVYSLGISGFGLLKWLGQQAMNAVMWLIGLLPSREDSEGELQAPPPAEALPEEIEEDIGFSIPLEWLIGVGAIIGIIIAFIILTYFLRKWRPPKRKKKELMTIQSPSWWHEIRKRGKELFYRIKMKWRAKFKRYYEKPIYWYCVQVQKWGKKNGIPRLPSETTKEYLEKIQNGIDDDEGMLVYQLSKAYEGAYYGSSEGKSVDEYDKLLAYLKKKKLSKKGKSKDTMVTE